MRYFILPEQGVHGECCPMTFRPGKGCMGTSGHGRKAVFGRGFMKSDVRKFENRTEGNKEPSTEGLIIDSQSVKTTGKRGLKAMMQAKNRGKKSPYSD